MGKQASRKSRIDLGQRLRNAVVDTLAPTLADLLDLYSQAKQAHWNVRGRQFAALHALFDQLAAALAGPIDDVAERIVTLGGAARGTVRQAAAASQLPELPPDVRDGMKLVALLADRHAAVAARVRVAIDAADAAGDAGSSDLLTGVSRGLDKALWMLESHVQS